MNAARAPKNKPLLSHVSLRHRYLAAAFGILLVIISSALITDRYVSRTHERSTENIEGRNQVQHLSRSLRNAIWGAEYALQAFILTPTTWYRDAVQKNIQDAALANRKLRDIDWISEQNLGAAAERIDAALLQLSRDTNTLMDIRSDIDRLYPALDLMDNTLSPANERFVTAAQLALQELSGDTDYQLMREFESALTSWLQMIGSFRLYVVRQTGIYGDTERGLKDAAHDISLHYQQMRSRLDRLNELSSRQALPLQAAEAVHDMNDAATVWHQAYQNYRSMRETGHWRADFPIIENKIQPVFRDIWENLDRIDSHIEHTAVQDVNHWSAVAQSLKSNIMLLSILAVVVIIAGYVFFQRTVLTPLTMMTRAMRSVAKGQYHEPLPEPSSLEARNLVEAFQHMQNKIEERQNELRHQTLHDALTGLPNRSLLNDRLEQTLLISARDANPFCLLMMDLDRFKEINDTLGHHVGDEVLCEVSRRLCRLLRKSDTVARLGGDEFAILLPETGEQEGEVIAQKIADFFEQPIMYNDQPLLAGTSVGIAVYPDHGDDVETLVKRADVAMYVAKHNGLSYTVYSAQQDQHSVSRLAMISELRHAINNDELELHYQPKVEIPSGRVVGLEALLRWPRWSTVPTETLIHTAEQTGLIRPLSQWVMQRVMQQQREWANISFRIPVAMNLSTWNLEHSDIERVFCDLLEEYGVPAEDVEIEITENAMLKNPERAMSILRRLEALGISLSVDDYGTGFSSLGYLKQMPVKTIKIDRSFVADMLEDENDAVIVRSTIDLAHNLGLDVVAEGVENKDIWDLLDILGCDTAQGYHIARPMPPAKLIEWIRNYRQKLADSKQYIA